MARTVYVRCYLAGYYDERPFSPPERERAADDLRVAVDLTDGVDCLPAAAGTGPLARFFRPDDTLLFLYMPERNDVDAIDRARTLVWGEADALGFDVRRLQVTTDIRTLLEAS